MKRMKKSLSWLLVISMIVPLLTSAIRVQAEDAKVSADKNYDAMTMEQIMNLDEPLTWVFAGDSITHNSGWTQGMNSYPEWFEQYLYEEGRNKDAVINTAWGGAAIRDFQTKENTPPTDSYGAYGTNHDKGEGIDKYILSYNPDIVFIKLGMNDRPFKIAQYDHYYRLMLDSIYESGLQHGKIPKVVVLTPTPVSDESVYDDLKHTDRAETAINHDGNEVTVDGILRFRNALVQIVKDYNDRGRHMLFCDLREALLKESEKLGADYLSTFYRESSDGLVHPNAAGQYAMFKALSKTLGIYDPSKQIYQFEYSDMIWAALYPTGTDNITYTNGYAADLKPTAEDEIQMNQDMAVIEGLSPIASVEFDSTNGVLDMGKQASIDITKEAAGIDPLTLEEMQGLQTSFSIVFRAKLNMGEYTNQPILFASSNGTDNWQNALTVGAPDKEQEVYYRLMNNGKDQLKLTGRLRMQGPTVAGDHSWHTVAIVNDNGTLSYYVDGRLKDTYAGVGLAAGVASIGSLFQNAANYQAQIGRYGTVKDGTAYQLNGSFDYWQFYDQALTKEQVNELIKNDTDAKKVSWADSVVENNVWAVAGSEQMAGYNGLQVNRSLMRTLNNAMRAGSHNPYSQRDIRMVNASFAGNTLASMLNDYEELIGKHNPDVLLLLPEVTHVYADDYQHSKEAVDDFKASVKAVLAKSEAKVNILWSPLASGNDKINGYIKEYAEAVREIARDEDSNLLFFDANQFMNDNMSKNTSLKRNWFDRDSYITPLATVDLAISFYSSMDEEGAVAYRTASTGVTLGSIYDQELIDHNLRYNSDARVYKGEYLRDNIDSVVKVDKTTVQIDISEIRNLYKNADITFKVMPWVNAGNYNQEVRDLKEVTDVTVDGNVYTFKAPCKNLNFAVYGKQGEFIYRFKDLTITVEGAEDKLPAKNVQPVDGAYLTKLQVVGAPDIKFHKDAKSYDVNLYQYQQFVRVLAEAHEDLTIIVDGKESDSGVYSDMIMLPKANVTKKVTVKVSGIVNGKNEETTYTLNLIRPEYADIIITEVMSCGYADKFDLIEVYNASGKNLNLADYSIGYKTQVTRDGVDIGGENQYYFTGNDNAFGKATYTGINKITKYSSYWSETEPDTIPFEKDSTMVIWVRQKGSSGTYADLINALRSTPDKTLNVEIEGKDTEIVPTADQLVVAEVPNGSETGKQGLRAATLAKDQLKNFYLVNTNAATRCWLFVLGKDAQMAENGAITQAGNDIISAARYNRISQEDGYSDVMSYNTERGVSLVKDQSNWLDAAGGHTSDEQGYGNYTSFGAVEYWQKPYDMEDHTEPVVKNNTPATVEKGKDVQINLTVSDETDVRYAELYYKNASASDWTKVTKDYVLEASTKNKGVALDTAEATLSNNLTSVAETVQYYGYVVDGNNNRTEFGTEKAPLTVLATESKSYTKAEIQEFQMKKEHPTRDGYLFGGWYLDAECVSKPVADITKIETEAYALFVPETVLSVKAQISDALLDVQSAVSDGSIRFITSVDSLRYQKIGFKITYSGKDGQQVSKDSSSNKVYEKLYAVGMNGGQTLEYTPKVFHATSNYFKACTITGVPEAFYNTAFTVTPYWITLDGTYVEGVTATKVINDGRYEAKIGSDYYVTLEDAVNAANSAEGESVVTVLRDAEVDSQMNVSGNVTIQNAKDLGITLYRGTGIQKSNMFLVASDGTLCLKSGDTYGSLTLDGRTQAQKEVAGSASLIANAGTMTVDHVTVQYAKASVNGGAINNTGTLNVIDTAFKKNVTTGAATMGGAIWSDQGTLTLTGTNGKKAIFEENEATYWCGAVYVGASTSKASVSGYHFKENSAATTGAMMLFAPAEVSDTIFERNHSTSAKANGGAIYLKTNLKPEEMTTFTNCSFLSNTSGQYAGAVQSSAGYVTCKDCVFKENQTTLYGGALYLTSSYWTMGSCQFEGNTAQGGGAIYMAQTNNCSLTLQAEEGSKVTPIFKENQVTGERGGGAICVWKNALLDVTGYTFESNQVLPNPAPATTANKALYGGGAISFAGNTYTKPVAADGGTSKIEKCKFVSNTAYNGGAVYSNTIRNLNIINCDFKKNTASQWGGAICTLANGHKTTITTTEYNVFEENYADTLGGAIVSAHNSTNATTTITGYQFKKNDAKGATGKTIFKGKLSTLNLNGCIFDQTQTPALDNATNLIIDAETTFGGVE